MAKCVGMSQFLVYRDPALSFSLFPLNAWHILLVGDEASGYSVVPFHNGHLQLCDVQHALQIARRFGGPHEVAWRCSTERVNRGAGNAEQALRRARQGTVVESSQRCMRGVHFWGHRAYEP